MGTCVYCGNSAGLLRKYHKACKAVYDSGVQQVRDLVPTVFVDEPDFEKFTSSINAVAKASYISNNDLVDILIGFWESEVDKFFEDGVLDEKEESILSSFVERYGFSQSQLNRNGYFEKVVKGSILREILHGTVPKRINVQGLPPFNLQKSEELVWVFHDVHYYEKRDKTTFVGSSQGFNIKVAKGVYYRTSGFKGKKIITSENVFLGEGALGVTTKHLYFKSAEKQLRIKFDSVISFEPYSDGIGLQKDTSTARPQIFITGDGWFTYNLVANLAQM